MIQLSELTKAYGDRVLLDHVTWQITDWERVGLCGPNGADKTCRVRKLECHAARSYSCSSPPRRSRRFTVIG